MKTRGCGRQGKREKANKSEIQQEEGGKKKNEERVGRRKMRKK